MCGCANNQLATDEDGDRLAARDVLYAPDYVVNAGGVMNIAEELGAGGYDHEPGVGEDRRHPRNRRARSSRLADEQHLTPAAAADHLAEARLAAAAQAAQPS